SAHLPSLQMVTDCQIRQREGRRGWWQSGWMGGAIAASVEAFFSELYLKNSGFGIEGPPCGLGGKGVLCLKLAKDEIVPGEHYTVKELPLYQEAKEADAESGESSWRIEIKKTEGTIRKAPGQKRGPDSPPKKTSGKRKLVKKHGKDVKEPTPPKEFPPPQTTYEGEVMIEEPVNAAPHSISSGPGRMSGLNHSGLPYAAARLANVAEEAASINRPGNLNPDADAAETAPLEEAGAESQSQPSDDPDRLAIVLVKGPPQEAAFDARSTVRTLGGFKSGSKRLKLAALLPMTLIRMEASPFSYAELEAKLKQITPDWKAIKPSAKMFDMIETLVRGLRSMSQQHDLFTQLLQTADYMRTFSSRHQEIENQLRLRMEEAEASLSTMREENEALRVELAEAKVEKNQLRAAYMRRREELAADYQQQVDDTFIFGYRCCMKKNGIKRDTPSIPPGEEKKLHEKPAP
ncbi:hypothetical protein CK203_050605, partial [Vitis vinifera]